MMTPTKDAIEVCTAQCQSGVISTPRFPSSVIHEEPEVISALTRTRGPLVNLEENTIYLNRTEMTFINQEVRRLLKAQVAETERQKKAHIPLPPKPGQIAYAVYQ